jgi:hypothetical protein
VSLSKGHLLATTSEWSTDGSGVAAAEQNLFNCLPGTAYNQILSQYNDTSGGYVHDDVTLAGTWTDQAGPSGTITATTLLAEVERAASANVWTNDFNANFIVLPQAGSTYTSTVLTGCADHQLLSGYVISLIPYLGDAKFKTPCSGYGANALAQTTTVTSHEYAEAATDPWYGVSNGWIGASAVEIGDLCAPSTALLAGTNISVQPLWSLASDSCVTNSNSGPKVGRFRNTDRVLSAVAYSRATWAAGGASTVVVVRNTDPGWVDGLPGISLTAGHGPVLLADSNSATCTSTDYQAMESEITRVLAVGGTLYVVGGLSGVPQCVISNNIGRYNIIQKAGAERCDSSVNVAGLVQPQSVVNLVSGINFPDAISMSSVAASGASATLVTPTTANGSPAPALCSTADTYLQGFGIAARNNNRTPVVRIAGGTAAVSASVEAEVNRDVCPSTLNCTVRTPARPGTTRRRRSRVSSSQTQAISPSVPGLTGRTASRAASCRTRLGLRCSC